MEKKRSLIIIICLGAAICLLGAAVIVSAVLSRRNPLAKGLMGLSEEIAAMREELGEHFWTDAVNQIGSESIQADYSVNIGGIPELHSITAGLDGEVERDMEKGLFASEIALGVGNAEIADVSFFGTPETLYLQIPSVWEGSVVLDAEGIDGQWNESAVKSGLQLLTGQNLFLGQRIDVDLFQQFYVNRNWADDFFTEKEEALKALYENMEVVKVKKAQKMGLLNDGQTESLENFVLEDAAGKRIMTTCYLAVLPKEELKEIFADVSVDIKLAVYLDSKKRIVRICTVPDETLDAARWKGDAALNLTGEEAVTDRLELELTGIADLAGMEQALPGGAAIFLAEPEVNGNIIIEKNREKTGFYHVECGVFLTDRKKSCDFSLKSNVQGERLDTGEKVSLEVEELVVKSQNRTVCRGSGKAEFAPLAETVKMPSGREYRIGQMSEIDAALFLAECMKNIYGSYSGYLKFLEGF